MTVADALDLACQRLGRRGLPFPRQDAEALLCWSLGRRREFLFAHPEAELTAGQEKRFRVWLGRRGRHFPLQYMRGEQEFFGRSFRLNRFTLIPRPETEVVVETALAELPSGERRPRAVDVGTGSGCIAVTLACQAPRLQVAAVDVCAEALKMARANARRLGCSQRVHFFQGDALSALSFGDEGCDLVVSNPPYVPWRKRGEVDPAVCRYEPRRAVFARRGGLEVYEKLLNEARFLLKPNGRLVVELGYDLRDQVCGLAARLGWVEKSVVKDLAGVYRCAVFRPEAPLAAAAQDGSG